MITDNTIGQLLSTNNNCGQTHPLNDSNGCDAEEDYNGADDLAEGGEEPAQHGGESWLNPSREPSSITSCSTLPGPVGRIASLSPREDKEPEITSQHEDDNSESWLDPSLRKSQDIHESRATSPAVNHDPTSPNEGARSPTPFPEQPPQTWDAYAQRGSVLSKDGTVQSEPNTHRTQRQRRPPKPKEVIPIVCQEWLGNSYNYFVDANLGPLWLECIENWLKFEMNLPLCDISSVSTALDTTNIVHLPHCQIEPSSRCQVSAIRNIPVAHEAWLYQSTHHHRPLGLCRENQDLVDQYAQPIKQDIW